MYLLVPQDHRTKNSWSRILYDFKRSSGRNAGILCESLLLSLHSVFLWNNDNRPDQDVYESSCYLVFTEVLLWVVATALVTS